MVENENPAAPPLVPPKNLAPPLPVQRQGNFLNLRTNGIQLLFIVGLLPVCSIAIFLFLGSADPYGRLFRAVVLGALCSMLLGVILSSIYLMVTRRQPWR